MTSDSTPVFALEKEALKTEIKTGLQVGVDHLEDKPMKRKPMEKYHNTRHLLKQYRKVAYAIQLSESDMNVRMEMAHGTRLSKLEVLSLIHISLLVVGAGQSPESDASC